MPTTLRIIFSIFIKLTMAVGETKVTSCTLITFVSSVTFLTHTFAFSIAILVNSSSDITSAIFKRIFKIRAQD